MKKVLVVLALFILAFSFVVAQDEGDDSEDEDDPIDDPIPTDNLDAAYQCLENLLDDRDEDSISLQEAIFSTLALGEDSTLKSVISSESSNGECWPSSSCNIKETSQALLALDRVNDNTEDAEAWLLSNSKTATELTWFLQIDITTREESSCTLTYQDSNSQIDINEDMTISGNPGSCFTVAQEGFWLQLNPTCVEEEFRISCDQDFVTSLLYQRQGSDTFFVSPNTHSQAALGTTEESINSKCFSTGNTCDYEGSLWATIALDQTGEDMSDFLPYLLALSEDNKRLFPSTFLHILTKGSDQYSQVVQDQQQGQYWQAPNTPYNRFYDTSLAMLSLQGTSSQELLGAQNYLLSIQTPEGCWNNNNIRDTAFVLYAGWPQSVSSGGGTSIPASCASQGYECTSSLFACTDAGGTTLDLDCDFGVCCSVLLQAPSCSVQGGIICSATQTCSGTYVDSLEGSCCLGSCQALPQSNSCELIGGGCFSSCTSNEEQLSESCDSPSLVCCKSASSSDGGGSNLIFWIIILILFIGLIILGIVYRNKLRLLLLNLKNKRRSGRSPPAPGGRRPPGPPYGPGAMKRPMRRPMPPRRRPAPRLRPRSQGPDKELDDTLKKLKEMSK